MRTRISSDNPYGYDRWGKPGRHGLTGGALLLISSFLLYSLSSPGNIPSDSEVRWSVSRQMIRTGSTSIEDTLENRNYAVGVDGRRYSFWGIGQSVCLLPFNALALLLEKLTPIGPKTADLFAQFLASLLFFPFVGALVVWLVYRLLILLNYSESVSIFVAAIFAFATMHFHYSVITYEQTQVAALLLLSIIFLVKNLRQRRFLYAWLLCLSLGLCLLFRLGSMSEILPIYLIAAGEEILSDSEKSRFARAGKWLLAGLCGTGAIIVFLGWYNYIRFGSILESGYGIGASTALGGHGIFESRSLSTLAAKLFSPGKSIFLYNPVLLLFPVCIYSFYRRHRTAALAAFSAVVGSFMFHSFHTTWAGDYAWSIRYEVPVLAFLILPLAQWFSRRMKSMVRILMIALIFVSCTIQLTSVVYKFDLEFFQNPNHCIIPDDYVWDLSQSHLIKRFHNIGAHLTGNRDFGSVAVLEEEPLIMKRNFSEDDVKKAYHVNFFPFKARSIPHSKSFWIPLLCFWLVLLVGFCAAAFKLVQLLISKNKYGTSVANVFPVSR